MAAFLAAGWLPGRVGLLPSSRCQHWLFRWGRSRKTGSHAKLIDVTFANHHFDVNKTICRIRSRGGGAGGRLCRSLEGFVRNAELGQYCGALFAAVRAAQWYCTPLYL